jgi:hypothetical protein
MGVGSVVRGNYFHDGIDAVSAFGTSTSQGLVIDGNFFQRMADNAIELEDHSQGVVFVNNRCEDVYEPISFQPLSGLPFPSSPTIAHNVIYDNPADLSLWQNMWNTGRLERCIIKVMIDPAYNYPPPATLPSSITVTGGWIIHNNTFAMLWGNVMHWQMPYSGTATCPFGPIAVFNNLFIDQYHTSQNYREISFTPSAIDWSNISFNYNVVAGPASFASTPGDLIAGTIGYVLHDASKLMFTDPANYNFVPLGGSYLVGKGVSTYSNSTVPAAVNVNSTVGAYDVGATMPALTTYGIQPGSL